AAGTMIMVVRKGHDRVEPVVAAGHLEDDQDGRVLSAGQARRVGGLNFEFRERSGQKRGDGPGERSPEDRRAQEFAPGLQTVIAAAHRNLLSFKSVENPACS